jgi:radical SAM superfamily enzyme YgiQ (UPF0313 family)
MLASVLENKGYTVEILDAAVSILTEKQITEFVSRRKPAIVGLTAMTTTINSAIHVAHNIKASNKETLVVLGGAHVSILPEETLKNNLDVDIIVRGEGEETFLDLVENCEKSVSDLSDVQGITYRNGSIVSNTVERPPIKNLDSLPFPAFHLLPQGKYRLHPPFGRKSPVMPIITSRGCPYNCVFCSKSVYGKKYRSNSPEYIIKEIHLLIDNFGVKEIKFYDDVFTLDRKRVLTLCDQLRKNHLDIPWSCETRVNLVDDELLKSMKAAGCYMIAFGVESGSQEVLKSIGKGITLGQIETAFNKTRNAGIGTVGYFMIGAPAETPETIAKTIEFAKKIDPDFVQFSIATPYPGTELYRIAKKKGCLHGSWDTYVYDANSKSIHRSIFAISDLTENQLAEWNRKAYSQFYLRWKYVWKRLRKSTSWSEIKTNTLGVRMLLDLARK